MQKYIDPKSGNEIAKPSAKPSYDQLNKGLHKKLGGSIGRDSKAKFTPHTGPKPSYDGIRPTMHEFKQGSLHSGSPNGPLVKNRKQAIAIGLSEERRKK